MAIDKIQAESINLADTFAFTGTVSGAGKVLQVVHVESNSAISSSSTIPADTSVPTSSEGVEILSTTFTSLNASSSWTELDNSSSFTTATISPIKISYNLIHHLLN